MYIIFSEETSDIDQIMLFYIYSSLFKQKLCFYGWKVELFCSLFTLDEYKSWITQLLNYEFQQQACIYYNHP